MSVYGEDKEREREREREKRERERERMVIGQKIRMIIRSA